MLGRLRTVFGDPLFVRQSRGVVPTPRAEALIPEVRSVLAGLRNLLDRPGFTPRDVQATISVGTTDYVLSVLIPEVFSRLRVLAPNLRVAVRPIDSRTLANELLRGHLDIALTSPEFTPSNMFVRTLYNERYLGAMRKAHPLAQGEVSLDAFCAAEHLLVSPDRGDFTGQTDAALDRIGRQRRVALVVPGFSAVDAVLMRTNLLAVLPARLLKLKRQVLSSFEPPVRVPGFDLNAVWSERVDGDPLHQWFRSLCVDAARHGNDADQS